MLNIITLHHMHSVLNQHEIKHKIIRMTWLPINRNPHSVNIMHLPWKHTRVLRYVFFARGKLIRDGLFCIDIQTRETIIQNYTNKMMTMAFSQWRVNTYSQTVKISESHKIIYTSHLSFIWYRGQMQCFFSRDSSFGPKFSEIWDRGINMKWKTNDS